jgi:hypothetical protein
MHLAADVALSKGKTMHISPESCRYDHLHGDEQYLVSRREVTPDDVIDVIANNTEDDNGITAREWIKHLADTDALYHLLVIVAKGRHKPAYGELIDAVKTEIEGCLS